MLVKEDDKLTLGQELFLTTQTLALLRGIPGRWVHDAQIMHQRLLDQPHIQFNHQLSQKITSKWPLRKSSLLGLSDFTIQMGGAAGYDSVMMKWIQARSPGTNPVKRDAFSPPAPASKISQLS